MENEKLKNKFNLSLDFRIIILALLIVIAGMLWMWKPWQDEPQSDRTISITGQATIKAVPDEFVFSPNYQFKNADKKTALAGMTKKSGEITAKLKEIGLGDSQIKSNSDGYNDSFYYSRQNNIYSYSLRLTVTANSEEQAQKVQDYLITTSASGMISPVANFSDAKRKELENQARDEATKDARAKADQSAKNLGFKVVSVKSVGDDNGFQNNYPRGVDFQGANLDMASSSAESKLQVQPGENDLNYLVTVVYFIR